MPNPTPPSQWKRRGFLGGALVATGAAVGWVVRQLQQAQPTRSGTPSVLDPSFAYDVSEFERTDPALLLFRPAGEFGTGLRRVRRLMHAPDAGLVVAGDQVLRVFGEGGSLLREIPLEQPAHCLEPRSGQEWCVGYADRVVFYDPAGRELRSSPPLGPRTFLTSLTFHGDTLFAADAGNREILICDAQSGEIRSRFGKKDPARGNPGFNVPSPYFEVAVAADRTLRVANTGLLRIESYTLDGQFLGSWGEPGMRIDRFCGCCNPVFFAMTGAGDFVTSEKGLARINLYGPEGQFRGAIAGPETLVEDKELAKRACADCQVGAGFDVAVTNEGAVLALDPFRKVVRRFEPVRAI